MSDLLASLRFVQWAVAKKAFVPELTHFQIKDGFIRSFNGAISLCCPINLALNCNPKAAAFLKAIQTCKETVQLSMTAAGRLSVKSGKLRALVECLPETFPEMAPAGREIDLEPGFMEALAALEPIIGEDASRPWSRGILFRNGVAYATNNIVVARYYADYCALHQVCIPHAAVNELLRISACPAKAFVEDNAVTFLYENGAWLRTSLMPAEGWPDVDRIIDGAETGGEPIPSDFFDGLKDIANFTDETRAVFFKPNYLTTSLDTEKATYINVQGLPDFGKFNVDMWLLLKDLAKFYKPTERPGMIHFAAENVIGAIIGMRE